jgi:hypothetical protein
MKNINIKLIGIAFFSAVLFSCTDDLERFPTNGLSGEVQFSTIEGYTQGLVTIYGVANNNGQAWDGGIFRKYFILQEGPTDEAVVFWDPITESDWSADNWQIAHMYKALVTNISYANNFLIEAEPDRVESRGFTGAEAEEIETYVAEARFLRAWYYWMLMDLFGNPPFPTEETLKNSEIPEQIQSAELFAYIESELIAIEGQMIAPGQNEYGRVDQGAAWALLARLYLNGNVYTGQDYYTEAITYSNKVINAGYALESNYEWLTLGDNNLCTNEIIFSIPFDNTQAATWEGTGFHVMGAASIPEEVNGITGSWGLFAFKPEIIDLFPSEDNSIDARAMIYTQDRTKDIASIHDNSQGYSGYKFRNVTRDGISILQDNCCNSLADVDFPVIRLAEIYLTYAEAVLRGGTGGDESTALIYMNNLRERAYGNTNGNITNVDLNLDFILDERARELYWESQRRTDLVRFGKFTSSDYLWAWKGGIEEGKGLSDNFNIYPLPTGDVAANPYLEQNPGY